MCKSSKKKSKFLLIITDYSYERLDGSVRGEERFIAVQNFNKNEDTFVFLLSTKAGK
jgi:SNF2 family DNA or RNA helicase